MIEAVINTLILFGLMALIGWLVITLFGDPYEPCKNTSKYNKADSVSIRKDGVYYTSEITGKEFKVRELTEADKIILQNINID